MRRVMTGSFLGFLATAVFLAACGAGGGGAGASAGGGLTMADVDARLAPLETELTSARADLIVAQETIAMLQGSVSDLDALLQHFSRVGNEVYLTGANLHVVNGQGGTETTNALGNVIIGYNESRGSGDVRTGSHMLVVGSLNNYSSFGGLAVGRLNTTSGAYASIAGGETNTASGKHASISGGEGNTASGAWAWIGGGQQNVASGTNSSVGGGDGNAATGNTSSVSGGWGNESSGVSAWIGGGRGNLANGQCGSVSGGRDNIAGGTGGGTNDYTSVTGGEGNVANGQSATVSGGHSRTTGTSTYKWVAGGLSQSD